MKNIKDITISIFAIIIAIITAFTNQPEPKKNMNLKQSL